MKATVVVRQTIEIEIDESKFTPEFMAEFRRSFYAFDSVRDHVEHIAQLHARGIAGPFIEGYGDVREFGIKVKTIDVEPEMLP